MIFFFILGVQKRKLGQKFGPGSSAIDAGGHEPSNIIFCNLPNQHIFGFFLSLESNEPIQFKNCALFMFSLKKIACELIENHDFDHF
jgi:hypothetical protein